MAWWATSNVDRASRRVQIVLRKCGWLLRGRRAKEARPWALAEYTQCWRFTERCGALNGPQSSNRAQICCNRRFWKSEYWEGNHRGKRNCKDKATGNKQWMAWWAMIYAHRISRRSQNVLQKCGRLLHSRRARETKPWALSAYTQC